MRFASIASMDYTLNIESILYPIYIGTVTINYQERHT